MNLSGYSLEEWQWLGQLLHCQEIRSLEMLPHHAPVRVLCMVQSCRKLRTKSGAELCFLRLEDASGSTEAIVFPEQYASVRNQLQEHAVLLLNGTFSRKQEKSGIHCDRIYPQQQFPAMLDSLCLCLKVSHSPEDTRLIKEFSAFCRKYPGKSGVVLYFTDSRNYAYPKQNLFINLSELFLREISEFVSPEKIGCIPGNPETKR